MNVRKIVIVGVSLGLLLGAGAAVLSFHGRPSVAGCEGRLWSEYQKSVVQGDEYKGELGGDKTDFPECKGLSNADISTAANRVGERALAEAFGETEETGGTSVSKPGVKATLVEQSVEMTGPMPSGDVLYTPLEKGQELLSVKWTLTNNGSDPVDKLDAPFPEVVYGPNREEAELELGYDGGPLMDKDKWTRVAPGKSVTQWRSWILPADAKDRVLMFNDGQEIPLP